MKNVLFKLYFIFVFILLAYTMLVSFSFALVFLAFLSMPQKEDAVFIILIALLIMFIISLAKLYIDFKTLKGAIKLIHKEIFTKRDIIFSTISIITSLYFIYINYNKLFLHYWKLFKSI